MECSIFRKSGYDMHCHTKASDGNLDLEDLVKFAKQIKLDGFTVTDHDILDSSKKARYVSEIEVIPGVELSGKFNDEYLIEVTGYFVDPFNKELEEICKINRDFRQGRIGKIIHRINEKYKDKLEKEITYEEVIETARDSSIGLNHINKVLIAKGLFQGREAFAECLNQNHPDSCYVERDAVDLDTAINSIITAGGVVGVPHPALVHMDYPDLTDKDFFNIIAGYFGKKIHVMETDYPYEKVRPECYDEISAGIPFWISASKQHKLIGVAGSDGHQKPDGPELGEKRTAKRIVEKIRKLSKNA